MGFSWSREPSICCYEMLCSSGRPVLRCIFTNLSSLLSCVAIILPSRLQDCFDTSNVFKTASSAFSVSSLVRKEFRYVLSFCFAFLSHSHVLPKVLSKDEQRILHWRILYWRLQPNLPIRQIKFPANLTTYTVSQVH